MRLRGLPKNPDGISEKEGRRRAVYQAVRLADPAPAGNPNRRAAPPSRTVTPPK